MSLPHQVSKVKQVLDSSALMKVVIRALRKIYEICLFVCALTHYSCSKEPKDKSTSLVALYSLLLVLKIILFALVISQKLSFTHVPTYCCTLHALLSHIRKIYVK